MSISWSDQEKTLLEAIRATLSTREVAEVYKLLGYNRSVDAIQKQAKKLGIYFKDFGTPTTHGLTDNEVGAINTVVSARQGHIEAIELPTILSPSQRGSRTSQRRETMTKLMDDLREARREVPRFGSARLHRADNPDGESLVIQMSDWHVGRNVLDTETNKQTYNIDIALDRIVSTPERVASLFSSQALKRFDECVLLLVGDHVDGEGIFPHHEMSIHEHAAEQVLRTSKAVWTVINKLRELFPLVRVVTTKGNHGRTSASPEANWDNMVYQQLELLVDMDGGQDITIKNRYGDFTTVDIRGWKGLLRHKAPPQADTAGGKAKFGGWYGIHEWDFFCFGHWHHWGVFTWNSKAIFRNGSLSGGDDYAESLAADDEPVQLCFGVSAEAVPTFIKPIRYR